MGEVMVSTLLCNILIGTFILLSLAWTAVAIQTFISDRRSAKRELEYHKAKMERFKD